MDALKRIEKTIWESAFEEKKEKPRLKFNPVLLLIVLRTTGPRGIYQGFFVPGEGKIHDFVLSSKERVGGIQKFVKLLTATTGMQQDVNVNVSTRNTLLQKTCEALKGQQWE